MNDRCFILGGAPSLLNEDLSLIKNEDIFTCNRGYKIKSLDLDFKYYVLADRKHAQEFYKEIEQETSHAKRFFSSALRRKNTIEVFNNQYTVFNRSEGSLKKFPDTLEEGWGRTRNVVTDAIIIAYFLGYKEIYLLGVNLDYSNDNNHFYEESNFETRHKNKVPDNLQEILNGLKFVSDELKKKNIKLTNLSKGFKHTKYLQIDQLENIYGKK